MTPAILGALLRLLAAVPAALALLLGTAAAAQPAAVPSSAREIRVVGDHNFPPFLFLDAEGRPQGYTADLWRLWEVKTGVRVRLDALPWEEAQRQMRAGAADVIDTIYRTPQREAWLDFLEPYATQTGAIFRHVTLTAVRDLGGLQGFTVGVQAGDACVDHLELAGITNRRAFPTYRALFEAVAAGQIWLFCIDDYPAAYFLAQFGLQRQFVKAFDLYRGDVRHAVRKGDAAMRARVAQGMQAITTEERETLRRRWLAPQEEGARRWAVPHWLPWALAGLAAMLLALAAWIALLRRQVRRRTAELARDRETLAGILDTIPDLVWLKDPVGRYLACNRRFEQLYGVPQQALLGRTDYDFVDVATADAFRAHDQRAIEAGGPHVNEEVLTFASDGHREHVQTIKTPLHAPDGRLIGVLGIARDLTELLATRDALAYERRLRRWLQTLCAAAPLRVDLATQRWQWDADLEALLPRPSERAAAPALETLLACLPAEDRAHVRAALQQAMAGDALPRLPLRLQRPDGTLAQAELLLELELDEHGRPAVLHGLLRLLAAAADPLEASDPAAR
ncbi:Virulence sensor protein BvgS [Tepidimonas sediminis]|uniref:Virulence sensor protein BvgS n=1 Tax=Tepidimonas sediminis TaxID=2588941 RepID=A0A554WIY0_9BURK|nr:transporter substrate-binding domain-containing protein [Tepidimonas sediminis]TSE23539.1 Virulence sensor protein BvgS [Tepidimonas sediminis]